MSALLTAPGLEHLTPHDLVTYFHCPHEMELHRHARAIALGRAPSPIHTPESVVPLRHSPMFAPPLGHLEVNEGRLDVMDHDLLVYEDDDEDDLPMLFPSERIRRDPRFIGGAHNLTDDELGLTGRPDFIIQRASGDLVPVEYKSTHLFVGYHEAHGRLFDTVQSIAECRLVHAVFGRRPSHGIVLYGDSAGGGVREGWVRIPYDDAEERWLKVVLG